MIVLSLQGNHAFLTILIINMISFNIFSVQTLVPLWETYWNQVREAKKAVGQKAGILVVLVKCFWPTFLLGAIYQLAYVLLQFASPQILGKNTQFLQLLIL